MVYMMCALLLLGHVMTLFVFYTDVPVAHLELGHSLRYEDIKEGDDLYLECNVQAVPPFTRLFWRHNVSYY